MGSVDSENASGDGPPSQTYTTPADFTVSTSAAMLNNVRYVTLRVCVRNVHWLQALHAATSIVGLVPSSSSAATSTAYEIDIVEPDVVRGRLTFSAEASEESSSRARKSPGCSRVRGA